VLPRYSKERAHPSSAGLLTAYCSLLGWCRCIRASRHTWQRPGTKLGHICTAHTLQWHACQFAVAPTG
jgi:hypothetical protein